MDKRFYPNDSSDRAVCSLHKLGKSIFRSGHVTIPTCNPCKTSFKRRNVVRGIRVTLLLEPPWVRAKALYIHLQNVANRLQRIKTLTRLEGRRAQTDHPFSMVWSPWGREWPSRVNLVKARQSKHTQSLSPAKNVYACSEKMTRDRFRVMSLAPRRKCPRNVVQIKEAMAAFLVSDRVAISCHCKRVSIGLTV